MIESGEPREVHHFCVMTGYGMCLLLGVAVALKTRTGSGIVCEGCVSICEGPWQRLRVAGADAVNPYMAFVAIERLIREVRPFRCDCVCVGAYGMRMCCLRLLWRAQAASPWRTTPRLVVAAVVFGAWSEFERSGWGLVGAETGCAGALCRCRVVLCVGVVWCQTEASPGR